jgi:hypothetical protein
MLSSFRHRFLLSICSVSQVAALLASPLPAVAQYFGHELNVAKTPALPSICWIAGAVREGAGVRVMFYSGGPQLTGGTKSQGRFVIGRDGITWVFGPKKGETESGLLLGKEESAALRQGPEDGCHITVDEVDGYVGITAHASFSVPLHQPTERSQFIPAR